MKHSSIMMVILFSIGICSTVQSQWVHTNGPNGGQVNCLAVSGTNLFAVTNGGVFRSTDSGTSWTVANAGLAQDSVVLSLAVSDTILFAGTLRGGVFISTTNGTSWGAVNAGFTRTRYDTAAYTPVTAFAVSPNGTGGMNLFAGTSGGGVWRRSLSEMVTGVKDVAGNGVPERFELAQNYPNPFNPSTKIRFPVGTYGYTSLRVSMYWGRRSGCWSMRI